MNDFGSYCLVAIAFAALLVVNYYIVDYGSKWLIKMGRNIESHNKGRR